MESLDKTLGLLTNLSNLLFFILVFVPGFISVRTYETIRGGEQRKINEALVDVIVYGFATVAIWLPIGYALLGIPNPWVRVISLAIASPLALIYTPIQLARQWYALQKRLSSAGKIASLDPKPWDRIFTAINEEKKDVGVVLTLPDGRRIGGRYARSAPGDGFASSYPADEQLLIGEVWVIDADGYFVERLIGSLGMIIDKKDVLTVEFFDWAAIERDLGLSDEMKAAIANEEMNIAEEERAAVEAQLKAADGGSK